MNPSIEDLIAIHKKGIPLEEIFEPLKVNFLAQQEDNSKLLFSCLNRLPYEYFSSFLSEKEFISIFKNNGIFQIRFRLGALGEATQDLSKRFGDLPEVKSFFQETRDQIISELMLYCKPKPFEMDNSNSKEEFCLIMNALCPLFGDERLDETLQAHFKRELSGSVSELQFSELINSCLDFDVQKQFVDAWSNDFYIPKKFDTRPFKKLRGLVCLITKETVDQIGEIMDGELGNESSENVQRFFLLSAFNLLKSDRRLLDKPYLQNAIRSLKDQEDKPFVNLPLIADFMEDGGVEKLSMGFKKYLSDFSLKELAYIRELMEEFQGNRISPYFFWDEVCGKLSFLKLFESKKLSTEKWSKLMEFFSEPREEYEAWPQNAANDFASWLEKKRLLSISGDRDLHKKVKVKI